jgi:RNA polymerase primary sigma factor
VNIREEPESGGDEMAPETQYDPDDPVSVYLREMGTVPPLTRADEIALTRRIGHGGQEAETAKKDLVEANLKMVIPIARRYASRGVHILDLRPRS